ncbi:TPA: peptidylprolyl isomerase [Candidatus Taylorbacteria bacterium]|nr:peptidylprolyl isomerase [Candidatus Taylorbacteria bacterium]
MSTLGKKEWIAIAVALAVVLVFLGSKFWGTAPYTPVSSQTITSTTTNVDNTVDNSNATKTGLIIKDVVVGTGTVAKAGNLVSVQYTGKFADGKVFDSSIPRGKPIDFMLGAGQVIKGWDQGIDGMKVGGERTLTIPPELGYGATGYPPVIPANATLFFDVKLVGVQAK